jgi:hypothetical protein
LLPPREAKIIPYIFRIMSDRAADRLVLVTVPGPSLGAVTAPCPAQTPPPNPTAAELDGRRVLARVGVADHEVTPQAPLPGSGWRAYSYGGFGGGHPNFHLHADRRQPNLTNPHYQLGICPVRAFTWLDLQGGLSAGDRERPLFTGVNGTVIFG